jgi:hypothetical protein
MLRAITMGCAVAFFLSVTATVRADEAKGTIKSVDTGRNEIVIKGVVKDTVYELGKNTSVWLDGKRCKLADLGKDDTAIVNFEKKGEHLMVNRVRVLRSAQEASGTVKDVLGTKNEITLKGTVKDTTYELNKDGTVWIDGKQARLTDVRAGDQVLITFEQRGDRLMATDVTMQQRK